MVIIRYPEGSDPFIIQQMLKKLEEENPKEHFIALQEGIDWIDLSDQDLYRIKEEIEDAIHDHEVIESM